MQVLFFILLAIFFCSCLGYESSRLVDENPSAVAVSKTIYVDAAGGGDFKTVQSAIDSIPDNNNNWIGIHVKAGIYREQVIIPNEKPFILLEGEGTRTTKIVWNGIEDISKNATFICNAENFVAKWIQFKNAYYEETGTLKRGVAVLVAGDKCSFYNCSFISGQDTLFDYQGRHLYKSCYFEGYVDFIFGFGQSRFEKSVLYTTNIQYSGYITAQGRDNASDSSGFVFIDCVVKGAGKSYLGRAWRSYSRVLFYKTAMLDVIVPEGWDPWNYTGSVENIVFAEEKCRGPGADTSKRVSWEKKLTGSETYQLIDVGFIDKEGWLEQQP